MKIAKGVLSDDERKRAKEKLEPSPKIKPDGDVEKNRLFQTLNQEAPSRRNYLKLLGIVVAAVVVGGIVVSYLMVPGVGDQIKVSNDVEMAVRDHFLTREKRTATDITFYQCDGFYGARVGVETRSDLPNPIMRIANYTARATASGGGWNVTAQPVTSVDTDRPCL